MSEVPWFLHPHGWNDHLYENCPALVRNASRCDVAYCDKEIRQGQGTIDPADYLPPYEFPKDLCGWCQRVYWARERVRGPRVAE